jgi:hypothetical protein
MDRCCCFDPIRTKKRCTWGISTMSQMGFCPRCPDLSKKRALTQCSRPKAKDTSINKLPRRRVLGNRVSGARGSRKLI